MAQPRSEPLYGALRLVAPGTPLREGIDRILQAKMGALIVARRRARGAQHLLRRVSPRRRVHAAAAVRARQDGRRDHPRLRRDPGRRGRTCTSFPTPTSPPPRPAPATAPPSASRARSTVPVFTVSEEMGVVSVHYRGLQAHARRHPARARPRRPGAPDPRPLQGAPRRRHRRALGARGRGPRDAARRRHRAAARRDGAPHRRRDRGLRGGARRRRPPGRAAARGAHRRRRGRPARRGPRLLRRVRARGRSRSSSTISPSSPTRISSTCASWRRCSASPPIPSSTRRCSRAATGSSPASRASPTRSPTT